VGLGKVFKPLFAKRHRKKMSPGAERSALEEFNEKVEYVRGLIQRMGYEGYVSDKLEYEIARAIAKRLSALADYDLREIINEIFDNIDKSLNIGENLRIVESILNKYASNTYDSEYIESMYEAYQRWLESQAQELREGAESREHHTEGWKSVLSASASGQRKRKRAEKRAERVEAKDMAELKELMAKVSELASTLSEMSAKLNELSGNAQLAELTKELRVLRARIEEVSDAIEEIGAAHALVMGRLKELESAVKRLERELKELKDSVESAEPEGERERVGIRVDNRVASAEPERASTDRGPRESILRLELEVEVSTRGARIRLGERERKVDFRKVAKWLMQL
jgi:chromosome segregation ATPase